MTKPGNRFKNLSGTRVGKLLIQEPLHSRSGCWYWKCLCDCGNIKILSSTQLSSKHYSSCGCYRRDFRLVKDSAQKRLFKDYKTHAVVKNIEFKLSYDEVVKLTGSSCFYCGIEPSTIKQARGHVYLYNGIDRVDNLKGYEVDNCVPCCSTCNYAKRAMSKAQFISWIRRVYITQYHKVTSLTPGQLIDLLFTTDYKCWWAQEKLLDESLSDEERAKEARKAQEYNAKRTKLMRTIDEVFDYTDDTNTEKTYSQGNIDEKDNYTYFKEKE
jgi:hypothetical protein